MNFDPQVEDILRHAVSICVISGNEFVTPEHILYGMTSNKIFEKALESMGGDLDELIADLDDFMDTMLPKKQGGFDMEKADVSMGFSSTMEMAVEIAKNSGNTEVKLSHVIWGLYEQQESYAVYFLEKQVKDKSEFLVRVAEYLDEEDEGDELSDAEIWQEYAVRLNDEIGKHNPLIGRDEEIDRAIQVLLRREKNNPIFVGEPGVGKTAMAYGLAERIESGNVPKQLLGAQVFSLDLASLVAGTPYRGEFEKRVKVLMDSFTKEKSPIVFLDEIHTLIGTGGLSGSQMDASNLLKPYLEDGSIRFVGATTYADYNKTFSKNSAFARRFQKVDIKEPSEEETIRIIEGLKKNYEKFHGVKYGKGTSEYIVSLSKRFIRDKYLPDKAIDLLDEAGAYKKMHPSTDKKSQLVDKAVIEEVLSKSCGVPVSSAKASEVDQLAHLYDNITSKIFGQDKAVRSIVDAICMSRSGLLADNKPVASFLFVGPTGVGKTEVAKVLAKELGVELVRFEMSEYSEKHAVAKLIGSPAGYVGYEEGGLLTDAIRKSPYSVLLLDEIEKAHPDIFNILLQVMDYASLTDNKGQKADFSNVIIIMTSNAGAREIGKQKMGFGEGIFDDGVMLEEVKRVFTPEFRNRLSEIVTFNHMDKAMAALIADKKLSELSEKLGIKKVELKIDKKARDQIIAKGITREYGARELERVIDSKIKPLFVQELLFGKLKKGGKAVLSIKETPLGIKEFVVTKG